MRIVLAMLLSVLLLVSCRKSKNCEESNLDCSGVRCFAFWSYFDFRVVDKMFGTDLVFGPNPRYTVSDIKLFADVALSIPISLTVDNTRKIFQSNDARSEMYLEINGTDVYKLEVNFIAIDCCSQKVKDLSAGSQLVCSCCSETISIGVQ